MARTQRLGPNAAPSSLAAFERRTADTESAAIDYKSCISDPGSSRKSGASEPPLAKGRLPPRKLWPAPEERQIPQYLDGQGGTDSRSQLPCVFVPERRGAPGVPPAMRQHPRPIGNRATSSLGQRLHSICIVLARRDDRVPRSARGHLRAASRDPACPPSLHRRRRGRVTAGGDTHRVLVRPA
jgi:hypothetical protein